MQSSQVVRAGATHRSFDAACVRFSEPYGFHDANGGIHTGWHLLRLDGISGNEQSLNNRPVPNLASVRTALVRQLDDGTIHYAVSVVFENGVFLNKPVNYPPDGKSNRQRTKFFERTNIDQDGNLRFPNGDVITRENLYKEAVDVMVHGGPQIEAMSVPGPWFQIRK